MRKLSPTYVLLGILAAILIGTLLAAAEWRYKFSYSIPVQLSERDLGFRFRTNERQCRDAAEQDGRSVGFFGECGVVEHLEMRRVKIESHNAIASVNKDLTFQRAFISWLSAQFSSWKDVQFLSAKLWDSDFHLTTMENIVFEDVDLRGISFRQAKLVNVTFRNSTMLDMSFRGALLRGVKFEGTACINCDFSDTDMKDSKLDKPFKGAVFSIGTQLPFPYEQVGKFGFELRD